MCCSFLPMFNNITHISRPWPSGDGGAQVLAVPSPSLGDRRRVMVWNVGLQSVNIKNIKSKVANIFQALLVNWSRSNSLGSVGEPAASWVAMPQHRFGRSYPKIDNCPFLKKHPNYTLILAVLEVSAL